jgi:hypothetical protein
MYLPGREDPDSMTRQCNVEEFLDKNSQDGVVWKAQQLKLQAKNPDLDVAIDSLRKDYEFQISEKRAKMHTERAFNSKDLSPIDKRFMKKENEDLFREIQELERPGRDH